MRRTTSLAALGAVLATTLAGTAGTAQAAAGSASIVGKTATLNLDGADDNETVSVAGGVLVHTSTGGGLASTADWDSGTAGDQTVPADGTFTVVVNGGAGNDAVNVLAKPSEIVAATIDGGTGDDVVTGADTGDTLTGGDGNDRLVGAKGTDLMSGGAGNDTLVWNNGDGSDRLSGDAGNDATEVNGSATLGDAFTLAPEPGGVKFQRTNLVPFTLDTATERFQVNGLGGGDTVSAADGVGALTQLSVDGGAGADTISGSDGPDLLLGGEGDDVLSGGGGDDRVVGDRGSDTLNGGAGDDTLVWNNGDGTDIANGDAGRDDVEVNGAPTAGDAFTVRADGARIRFDRTNLVPFSIDIGSAETLHATGLGGDDTVAIGDVGGFAVTAAGGAGNDTLTGGGSSDTLLGGSGDDTIAGGGGLDVVTGDDGNDRVDIRDRTADVARGGDGIDSVVADNGNVDVLDGFENVDRTPNDPPAPKGMPPMRTVTIRGGTVRVRHGVARITVRGGAGSHGTLALRTARGSQVGRARFSVAGGASTTVRVKLRPGSGHLAGSRGRLRVVATASTGRSNSVAQSSRRLTLAFGHARMHR